MHAMSMFLGVPHRFEALEDQEEAMRGTPTPHRHRLLYIPIATYPDVGSQASD